MDSEIPAPSSSPAAAESGIRDGIISDLLLLAIFLIVVLLILGSLVLDMYRRCRGPHDGGEGGPCPDQPRLLNRSRERPTNDIESHGRGGRERGAANVAESHRRSGQLRVTYNVQSRGGGERALRRFGFRYPESCAICLEGFKEGERCRALPICGHCFHESCADRWLYRKLSCPICRSPAI